MKSRSIPKEETGVLSLLEKYPNADGRGVKIAIMDTGCDLAVSGLKKTSDGKPKYLDFIDCTGDGDVDMSKILKLNSTDSIEGISGRKLNLGEWKKNIEEIRLGAVRLYHLLPNSVRRRLQRERKEAFSAKHGELISQTQHSLDNLRDRKDAKNEKLKLEIKELELLLEKLQSTMQSYEDSGPLMDIVMFHDNGIWKAVIDLEASGNITKSVPMAAFGHEGQTGELGFGSAVTFCLQVYEDGKILSIVTDAGSHGTHVAGIAAANFLENSDDGETNKVNLNGVAPGAQILACKIGDGRVDSTETGTGLIRALIAAKKYGCDLVNLSYGEPSWQFDSGRVAETFSDAVHKWGMTVFTSAGNDGPALSSIGCPGSLSAPITVSAYVSEDMMVDQYSTLPPSDNESPLEGAPYYFTSRGPTPDGFLPDLCAPGGAIAPIPRHSLQGKAQYHGTSMASPNACGVAACILSALKQEGIAKCFPNELKRGLVNSATQIDISDPFAEGAGLISAVKAVEYIIANHGKDGQDLYYDISIPSRNNARGLYIRDAIELDGPMTFSILVKPRFQHATERTPEEMNELLSLELDLRLKPSQQWVTCPHKMTLLSAVERGGQTFSIRLNTHDLPPGVHYATVDAVDSSDPERGPLFQVPITVVIPHSKFLADNVLKYYELNAEESIKVLENDMDLSMTYKLLPGAPNRRFITVPDSAEWATIKIRSVNPNPSVTSPQRVYLHAIPIARGDIPNTMVQIKRVIGVNEGIEEKVNVRVTGGSTLELCLQLLWLSNPSPTSIVTDIEFHSLNARSPTMGHSQPVSIQSATAYARIGAVAMLRSERLNPSACLTTVQRTIRPGSYDITLGSTERDVLHPSDAEVKAAKINGKNAEGTQIYDMVLSYSFKTEADQPIFVVPSVPSLFHQLYDSPVDSNLWVLEDKNSCILGYGGSMHHSSPISLTKGDYIMKLHIRHPDRDFLEKMKDLPCQIAFTLPEPLSCNVYAQMDAASTPFTSSDSRSTLSSKLLRKGAQQDLYIARPTADIPKWCSVGDIITGSLLLDSNNKAGTSMQLVYAVPPPKVAKKDGPDEKASDDEEDENSLDDVIFNSKVKYLSNLRSKKSDSYSELANKLKAEKPMSIDLLLELLTYAKKAPLPESEKDELQWRAQEIEKVKHDMMKANGGPIDEVELAKYFGVNPLSEDELKEDKEAKKLKKQMEEQKKALKIVLLAIAVGHGELAESDNTNSKDFDSSVKELKKWVSGTDDFSDDDDKLALSILLARHARICQEKTATSLTNLLDARKKLNKSAYKEITKEIIKVYQSMDGTEHLIENANNSIYNRFPVHKQGLK